MRRDIQHQVTRNVTISWTKRAAVNALSVKIKIKTKRVSPCKLVVAWEDVVGERAMVVAWPSPLCVQRYPALGREGRNKVIEKNSCCERAIREKNKGSLTLRVGCGARGRCWVEGGGDSTSLFLLWAMISSVRPGET